MSEQKEFAFDMLSKGEKKRLCKLAEVYIEAINTSLKGNQINVVALGMALGRTAYHSVNLCARSMANSESPKNTVRLGREKIEEFYLHAMNAAFTESFKDAQAEASRKP